MSKSTSSPQLDVNATADEEQRREGGECADPGWWRENGGWWQEVGGVVRRGLEGDMMARMKGI